MNSIADDETVVVMGEDRLTTQSCLGGPETVAPQELVYGVLRDAPAPTPRHQDTAGTPLLPDIGVTPRLLVEGY